MLIWNFIANELSQQSNQKFNGEIGSHEKCKNNDYHTWANL